MPPLTLNGPPSLVMPSDTGVPGLTRRRVWAAPEVLSHSVVVLTLPRLFLSAAHGTPKPETLAAIEKGGDVEQVLGPFTTVIDLGNVSRVRHDLLTNTLHIEYRPRNGGTARTTVRFAQAEAADAVFSKIWRRLGPEFAVHPEGTDVWAAVREPVLVLAGVLISTIATALGLNAIADAGTSGLPGWRTACALGGAAAAAVTVWLYRRLTRPPERLDLTRTTG